MYVMLILFTLIHIEPGQPYISSDGKISCWCQDETDSTSLEFLDTYLTCVMPSTFDSLCFAYHKLDLLLTTIGPDFHLGWGLSQNQKQVFDWIYCPSECRLKKISVKMALKYSVDYGTFDYEFSDKERTIEIIPISHHRYLAVYIERSEFDGEWHQLLTPRASKYRLIGLRRATRLLRKIIDIPQSPDWVMIPIK